MFGTSLRGYEAATAINPGKRMTMKESPLYHPVLNTLLIAAIGIALYYLLFFLVRWWSKSQKSFVPALIDKHIHLSGLLLFLSVIANIALTNFRYYLQDSIYDSLAQAVRIALILAIGFFLVKVTALIKDLVLSLYGRREYKDYTLRSVKTKFQLIQRVINFVIVIFIIAAVLMTFEQLRQIGGTLLASAGVAGVVIGFAAQKSLGSLFAGIQIALSQPVKIEDTVVVKDTFGTIGEITLTYIVINTWDEKRLIVPITYFLEQPFENWTRSSSEVIGKVKIYADYTLPVDKVREEFEKLLRESPLWDKRSAGLQVTDATDKTIEVRTIFSTRNAGDAWNLQCLVRERLIAYIRENHPQSLPSDRIILKNMDEQEN